MQQQVYFRLHVCIAIREDLISMQNSKEIDSLAQYCKIVEKLERRE